MMTLRTNKARLFSLTSLFVLISWSAFAQNLIINGSFEQGNITSNVVGFETHYNKYEVSPPGNALSNAGDVTITSDPKLMNTTFIAQSGTKMLVVDGSTEAGKRLWGKEYQIKKGVDYIFSYWIKPVSSSVTNDINTQASVALWLGWNGELGKISPTVRSGAIGSDWKQVIFTVNIPGTGSQWVPFVLTNENTSDAGNDFALDNLSLIPPQPPLKITYSKFNGTCGEDGIIAIYGVGGYKPYKNYTISGPNLPTGYTNSNTTGIFSNLPTGTYAISVTDQKNTTVNETGIVITTNQITIIKNPDKTNYCPGDNITLTASGGQIPYTWTKNPTLPIISTPNANPLSVQPNANTTYTVTSTVTTTPTELIYNGDFSLREEGFYSDYEWYPNQNETFAQRAYGVTDSAKNWASVFQDCKGNGGSGNFLVADGSIYNSDTLGNGTDIVWQQAVPVKPNTNYTFSYYLSSLVSNNPAQIITKINGIEVGTNTASSSTCVWNQVSYSWNSGSNTVAVITLIDKNTQASGNDFGLDDMSFKQVGNSTCNVTKDVTINVSSGTSVTGFSYSKASSCQGDTETLTPTKNAGFTEGGTWSVSPTSGLNVNSSSGVITIDNNTIANDYIIKYKITALSCRPESESTFNFKVNVRPIFPDVAPLKFCHGETYDMNQAIYTLPTAGMNLAWTVEHSTPASTNLPNSGTGYPKFTTTNTGTTTLITKVNVTATSQVNGCVSPIKTFEIHVLPSLRPNVTCGTKTQNSVTFDWDAIAGASGYNISYKINNGSTQTDTSASNSYTKNGLNAGDKVKIIVTPTKTIPDLPGIRTNCFIASNEVECSAENCPTISNPSAKISVCSDDTNTHTISASTEFTGTNAIKFVYFTSKQTGNAMYSGGTSLGTATPSGGTATLTIPKIGAGSIPSTARTYYIYAIANPNPASASCRPFAEIEFEVKPKPVINTISNITVCNGKTVNAITFGDNLTGSTFAWSSNNNTIGLAASGTGDIAQFTATNTTTSQITATISVTSTNNSCTSEAKTFTITVNPTVTPIVDFSYTTPICKLDTTNPTPIKATGFSNLGTFAVTSFNASDLVFVSTSTGEIDLANTKAGIYDIKYEVPADATTCRILQSKTFQIEITDKITPVVEFTYPAAVCIGTTNPTPSPIDATKPLTTGGTFAVTSLNASDLKFVSNSTGEIDLTQTKAGIYTIKYSVTKTGCQDAGISTDVSIEIQQNPTISLKSAANTDKQEICEDTALTPIEYEILNGTGAKLTITPTTAEITGSYNPTTKIFTISGTPTTKADYTYEVETIGNCTQSKLTGTIKVKEDDSLVLTSDAATTNQTKCISTAITDIVYTYGGGATGVTVTGLQTSNYTINTTNKTVTISFTTPSTAQTINYSITTTSTNGSCKAKTLSGKITVTDLSNQVLTFTYAKASYCKSDTPNPIAVGDPNFVTGGTYSATPNTLVFVDDKTGEIDLSQTPVGTYQIKYTVLQDLANCKAGGTSPNVQVEIKPDATLVLNSAARTDSQIVCVNKPITDIVYEFGGGATNATVTGLPAGINLTIDTTQKTVTITGTPTATGTFTYKVNTTGTCTQTELTGTITVNANEVIETEFIYPSIIVCKNDTVNPIPGAKDVNKPLTTGGEYTSTTGLVINSLTGEINLASSTAGTYTVTYKVATDDTRCRIEKSSTFDITIKALPTIPTITGGKTICTGTSTDITIKGDAGSSVVYSIDGVNQGAIILNSNGEYTFSTGTLNQQTTYKIINVSYGSAPLCTVNLTTNVQAIVNVQNPPTATISQDTNICINTSTQITVTGTPSSVVTYVILSGLTTTSKTVTLNAQGTGTINTGNLSVDTRYRLEKVAITSNGTTCETSITNQVAVITINNVPLPIVPSPQYFCETLSAKVGNLSDVGLSNPKWYDARNVLLDDTTLLQYNSKYYVTQTIGGCESEKVEIQVILVPLAPNNLTPEIQICSNELLNGVRLDTGLSETDYNFLWTPTNENSSSIVTTYPGEHKVLISSKRNVQNCGVTYSTFIRAFSSPRVIETITGLNKFEVIADGGNDLPIEYSLDQQNWQTSNVFENLEPGDYKVYLRGANAKCITVTDATVLGMPNVVIPNGKDKNQKWIIHGIKKFPGTYIRIYDRYGKLLKEHIVDGSTDFTWDGTYLNRPLPSTSYWFDVLFPSGKKLSGYILLKNR